jgi:hypothetical protein
VGAHRGADAIEEWAPVEVDVTAHPEDLPASTSLVRFGPERHVIPPSSDVIP